MRRALTMHVTGFFLLVASLQAAAGLLVGDRTGDSILRYDDATGAFLGVFVALGSGGLNTPQGMALGPDGNLYVSSQSTVQILRYDGTTGAFLGVFVDAGTGGLSLPFDIVFDGAGDLLVANSSTSEILRFDGVTGAFVDVFASGGVPGLNTPRGLATDGLSLFTSAEGDRIYRFDATDGSFIASFGGNDNPRAMTFGPDGNLYVGNRGDGNVLRFDGTTGAFIDAFVSSGSGGLGEPGALLFTKDPTPVPEPGGALLFSAGLAALLVFVRKSVGG